MLIQDIYPSSKVDPEVIKEYGWEFVEDIATITNEAGRLAPTPERSDTHRELRMQLDTTGVATYIATSGEAVELHDFALGNSPDTERNLGFFALK